MKNFYILVLVVFAMNSCSPEKNVRIRGTLSGANAENVFLRELGNESTSKNDTVQLDAKGYFSFKHKISHPTFYSLTVNDKAITLLAYPGEKITIGGDVRHLLLTYSVEGSEDSKHIHRLNQRLQHTVFVGDTLERTLKTYEDNRNYVNIQRQFQLNYINEVDSLRAYNIRFMEQNPRSLAVIYALYQQLSQDVYLFDAEDDIRYFRKADSAFFRRYPKVTMVNTLHANVIRMNEQYNAMQLNRLFHMLGQEAPEITMPTPDNRMIKLSSLKGKYVLLDIWASWSAPSRTENINLLEIYNKYRHEGFEVYQVSLDQSRSSWERAIKEDGLPWINVSDLKFWDSEVVKLYGVETIPANFLIDTDGTIITKNLKGDALDKKLSEIFIAPE